ncbi:MAG: class I SAM-dependent RNA methyltransferase [Anaerolineales bacterium]
MDHRDDIVELTIEDMGNGGMGIARQDGVAILVHFTIPGEVITARITNDQGRYAFAEGIAVHEPSADRVAPRCPNFGALHTCCSTWQHMNYYAQLALKTDIVADQLERVGGFTELPVQMTRPSPEEWAYRHEARLLPHPENGFGFLAANETSASPLPECHLVTPELLAFYDQMTFDLPNLTQIILRENRAEDVMLMLSTADDEPPEIRLDVPASVNFLHQDGEPANLIGATHLVYHVDGIALRVTAGAAWRGNLPQIEHLVRHVRESLALTGEESILDIYSGVGLFAAALAPDANLITCIDDHPPAMTDAEFNLAAYDHVNLIEGDAAEVLASVPDDEAYDVAIFDPPPRGVTKDALDAFGELNVPRAIYISDNPAILARDANRLSTRLGYNLTAVVPFDFEPQTHRVVTVAHFEKG